MLFNSILNKVNTGGGLRGPAQVRCQQHACALAASWLSRPAVNLLCCGAVNMSKPSERSPLRTAPDDHDQDRDEVSHSQLLLESPAMTAILASVQAAVREEVRVAVAAQVQGAPGLLQPPQLSSEIPSGSVAVGSGEFRRAPILVFVGQIVHILLQVL